MKLLPILAAVLLCICGTRAGKIGLPPSLQTRPDQLHKNLTQRISQQHLQPLDLHAHKKKHEYFLYSNNGIITSPQEEVNDRTRRYVKTSPSAPAPVDSASDSLDDLDTWTETSAEPVSEQTDPCDRNCTKFELNEVCASNNNCLLIFANSCQLDVFNCRHPEGSFFALDGDKFCAVPLKRCDELLE